MRKALKQFLKAPGGKIVKKSVLIGLLITLSVYMFTVFRVSGSGDFYFRSSVERPFRVYINGGVNKYVGGAPFASETIYYYDVEGCPCGGIEKAVIIWAMIPTRGFFANWAVMTLFPATYLLIKEWLKHAHTRH